MAKKTFAVVLVILLILSLTSCGKTTQLRQVKISVNSLSPECAALCVAKELGYFTEEGILVELQNAASPSSVTEAVRAEKAEFGLGNLEEVMVPEGESTLRCYAQVQGTESVLYGDSAWEEEDPYLVQGIVNAIYKGQVWINSRPVFELAELLGKTYVTMDLKTLNRQLDVYETAGKLQQTPLLTEQAYQVAADTLQNKGMKSGQQIQNYQDVVSTTFAEEAMK